MQPNTLIRRVHKVKFTLKILEKFTKDPKQEPDLEPNPGSDNIPDPQHC